MRYIINTNKWQERIENSDLFLPGICVMLIVVYYEKIRRKLTQYEVFYRH